MKLCKIGAGGGKQRKKEPRPTKQGG